MTKYDVIGIGSALLDFIITVDDGVLAEIDLCKGQMHLIGPEQSKQILKKVEKHPVKLAPGGSSANTLAGIAAFGGSAVLLGKIGKDRHGDIYEQKTTDDGVVSRLGRHDTFPTGHAITFITPDSERTFATHLGASLHLRKEDVFEDEIANSRILHIEGYQLEDAELKATAVHAMQIAKKNSVKISIDLADPALVNRNLTELKRLVDEYADIIFVNEHEAEAFTGKKDEEALHEIYKMCKIAVVKLGPEGSLIKANGMIYKIPVYKTTVVNTNGAGDMYASGILYGIARGLDMEKAGHLASYAASRVVASADARLTKDMKEEVKKFMMDR